MLACLATVEPLDPATGTRLTVRVSSVGDMINGRKVNGLGDVTWEPALVQPPVLGISLWNGDFQAAVEPASAVLPLAMAAVKKSYPRADQCAWIGAPVEVFANRPGQPWPWPKIFKGRVSGYGRRGQTLSLTAEVDTEPFRANLLTATYAGTGGAAGGVDLKKRVKPLALGWPLNVEPVLIDATNSVYQFSAYGAIEAVTKLYERGSDFGAATGDFASYTALVAATIPAGKWGTCLAEGMIRLGAPAFGVITGDIKGHKVGATAPRLSGAVIQALATLAGIDAAMIDKTTLDALDADVPYPVNLVLSEQESFFETARSLALGCNYQSGASLTGTFFVAGISLDAPETIELDTLGRRSPQVTASEETDVSVPYWRTVLGANRAWRVHSAEEIAFQAPLVERGLYAPPTTYREGNVVDQPDGSRWLYIFATATAGNAPPTWPTTSNTWWSNLTPPLTAANLTYADGVTLEARKPAEIGADVTSTIEGAAEIVVQASSAGVVDTGQLPKTSLYKMWRNGVDVTTSAAWSVAILSGTFTASIGAATGIVSLNASGGSFTSGTIRVTSVYLGMTRTRNVTITKKNAPATAPGGANPTSASAAILSASINSATVYTTISAEMTCAAGAAGTVTLNAGYGFTSTGTPQKHIVTRWEEWNGSAWVQIGVDTQSTNPAYVDGEGFPTDGYGTHTFARTGLVANSTGHRFRLTAKSDATTSTVARNAYNDPGVSAAGT